MSNVLGCCCPVPCSPSFSCAETKGTVDWSMLQTLTFDRSFSGVITSCCDWDASNPDCDEPDVTGPTAVGYCNTTFTGSIEFDYNYTSAIDLPQSISVSTPPTRSELCSLAVWEDSASSSCTTVANTRDVSTDLAFEISYKYGSSTFCTSGEYGNWNFKMLGDLEIEWVTEPAHSIDGNLQTYTQGVGEHYTEQACTGTDCLSDECVTDWLADGTGSVRVRWNTTYYEYASDDLTQTGTPTYTDTYTTSWSTVDVFSWHRALYGPMSTCSFKVLAQQTLEASIESLWSNLRSGITSGLSEAYSVIAPAAQLVGVFPAVAVTYSGANPNTGGGTFVNSTSFYSGVEDDIGTVGTDGDWDDPTGCTVFNHYRDPTSMVYTRYMDFEATIDGDSCTPCGVATSLDSTDDYYFQGTSQLSVAYITPDSSC